jgi:PST family polysaccharide transporter
MVLAKPEHPTAVLAAAETSTEIVAAVTEPSLGSQVGRGAAWSLLNNLVLRAGSLVSGIALARLLSPHAYGVYAVALVVLTLLQSMNELGVSLAVVRWQDDLRSFAPTVMTIAMASSVVLYIVAFFGAPLYCHAMHAPDAVLVLRVLCIAVVLDGVACVPAGILNREFKQRSRLYCDALSFASSTGLTIGLAVAGAGAMSLAWGSILGNVVSIVCYFILCPIRVFPGWNPERARALMRFGLPLAGASLLVLAVSNVDNIIVGASLNSVALGFYLMAFNQSSWPLTVFSEAARRVSLAGFSRLVDDDRPAFDRAFRRGLGLLMAATIPVCALLAAYAEPMLRTVYGEKWVPAASALRYLAILGLFRVALFVAYDALVALGRSRVLISLQALWLAALIPALIVGTHLNGIRGAAIAHAAVAGIIVTPVFLIVLARLGIRPLPLLATCLRPALGGAAIVGCSVPVLRMVHGAWSQLLIGGAVSVLVYVPFVLGMRTLLPGQGYSGRHRGAAELALERASAPSRDRAALSSAESTS